MKPRLIISTAFGASLAMASPALADGLSVAVEGVRNDAGQIIILIFDDARAYAAGDYWRAADYANLPARAGSVEHSFPELNEGPYAVFVFHDENGDDDLNYSATEYLEGVGVTGASADRPEPGFDEASVPPGRVTISLYYSE
jgi:uncharacterized protein (DUF2141 family)